MPYDNRIIIAKPVKLSTDEIKSFAAKYIFSRPFLDKTALAGFNWNKKVHRYILPLFLFDLVYDTDYTLEIGVDRKVTVMENGVARERTKTEWRVKDGHISGSLKTEMWGSDAMVLPQINQCDPGSFSIPSEIESYDLNDDEYEIIGDEPPSASAINLMAERDARQRINSLYLRQHIRRLRILPPNIRIENDSLIRLPVHRAGGKTENAEFNIYVNGTKPAECGGAYPQSKTQKSIQTGLKALALLLIFIGTPAAFFVAISQTAFFSAVLIALTPLLLGLAVLTGANKRQQSLNDNAMELLKAALPYLNEKDKPFAERWDNAVRHAVHDKTIVGKGSNPKSLLSARNVLISLAIILLIAGLLSSNKSKNIRETTKGVTVKQTVTVAEQNSTDEVDDYTEPELCRSLRTALEKQYGKLYNDLLVEALPFENDDVWIGFTYHVNTQSWDELTSLSPRELYSRYGSQLLTQIREIASKYTSGQIDIAVNIYPDEVDYLHGCPTIAISLPHEAKINDEFSDDDEHPYICIDYSELRLEPVDDIWMDLDMPI